MNHKDKNNRLKTATKKFLFKKKTKYRIINFLIKLLSAKSFIKVNKLIYKCSK